MATICGIELENLSLAPTAEELATIVAAWCSVEQATFFMALGEKLTNICGHSVSVQWQYIADAIWDLENELSDHSGSQIIEELHERLASFKNKENAA